MLRLRAERLDLELVGRQPLVMRADEHLLRSAASAPPMINKIKALRVPNPLAGEVALELARPHHPHPWAFTVIHSFINAFIG